VYAKFDIYVVITSPIIGRSAWIFQGGNQYPKNERQTTQWQKKKDNRANNDLQNTTQKAYKQEYTPYLYMEYISCSWSYIAELVGPIIISLTGGCCWQGSYLINGYHWLSWSHHFGNFTAASMTWLTVTEYFCHKWPRICSTCHKHFSVLCTFITYYRIRN
jgi:hypothetical protein